MIGVQVGCAPIRQGSGGSKTHFVGDGAGAHIECSPEDGREAQRVVDLVREIRASCGDNGCTGSFGLPGPDLRYGVGAGEHYRVGGHARHPFREDHPGARGCKGDDHICSGHGFRDPAGEAFRVAGLTQRPGWRERGDIGAVLAQDAARVDHNGFGRVNAPGK